MNFDPEKIQVRAAQAEKLSREIAELNQSAVTLQNQKAELTAVLLQEAPAGFILDNDGLNGDAETDAKLARLNRINTKLDLLPGIRARLQQDLAKVGRELSMDLERTLAEARGVARVCVEALREEYVLQFLPVCGGDNKRASIAADAVIQQTEAHAWYEAFKGKELLDGKDAAAKLQGLLKHVARFDAGETLRTK